MFALTECCIVCNKLACMDWLLPHLHSSFITDMLTNTSRPRRLMSTHHELGSGVGIDGGWNPITWKTVWWNQVGANVESYSETRHQFQQPSSFIDFLTQWRHFELISKPCLLNLENIFVNSFIATLKLWDADGAWANPWVKNHPFQSSSLLLDHLY